MQRQVMCTCVLVLRRGSEYFRIILREACVLFVLIPVLFNDGLSEAMLFHFD